MITEPEKKDILYEYEEILLGTKPAFTMSFRGTARRQREVFTILWRYAIEDIMGYKPEEAGGVLNHSIIKSLLLDRTFKYVDIIYNGSGYFNWNRPLSIVYPNIYHYSVYEEVESEYQKLLRIGPYKHAAEPYALPKGFFSGGEGFVRAKIIVQLAIRYFKNDCDPEQLYEFFGCQNEAKKWLIRVKIWNYVRQYFQNSALDCLHTSLPPDERSRVMYMNQVAKNILAQDVVWRRNKFLKPREYAE